MLLVPVSEVVVLDVDEKNLERGMKAPASIFRCVCALRGCCSNLSSFRTKVIKQNYARSVERKSKSQETGLSSRGKLMARQWPELGHAGHGFSTSEVRV